jgi:hypothetical protein
MRTPRTPIRSRINRPRNRWLVPFNELEEDDDFFVIGGGSDETKEPSPSGSSGK